MGRLENRVAIVTGAGQGIGRAIALGMAREGASIFIADINAANAATVKQEITAQGGRAAALRSDISEEQSVRAMVESAIYVTYDRGGTWEEVALQKRGTK